MGIGGQLFVLCSGSGITLQVTKATDPSDPVLQEGVSCGGATSPNGTLTYILNLASAFDADGLLKGGLTNRQRVLVDTDKLTDLDR